MPNPLPIFTESQICASGRACRACRDPEHGIVVEAIQWSKYFSFPEGWSCPKGLPVGWVPEPAPPAPPSRGLVWPRPARRLSRAEVEEIIGAFIARMEAPDFPVVATEMYVCGSYSRGSRWCGDIDLIMIRESTPAEKLDELLRPILPKYRELPAVVAAVELKWIRQACTAGARIDLHTDPKWLMLPHVLLWTRDDRDWRTKAAAIPVDPMAGRYNPPGGRKDHTFPWELAKTAHARTVGGR